MRYQVPIKMVLTDGNTLCSICWCTVASIIYGYHFKQELMTVHLQFLVLQECHCSVKGLGCSASHG